MRILISGHNGFIGKHLRRNLKIQQSEYEIIFLTKSDFKSSDALCKKIKLQDVIFHFAGVNRDETPEIVYKKNHDINQKLLLALNKLSFKGKLLFTSSTQEEFDNEYGSAKKAARIDFENQSKKLDYKFYGIITPNIFGPFCKPNYNSFISTFSKMIIDGDKPVITDDKYISLIYINDFVNELLKIINDKDPLEINSLIKKIKVSEILNKLEMFNKIYINDGKIPEINSNFDLYLFNTFRSYINYYDFFPKNHKLNKDKRGSFTETIRSYSEGQSSYSITKKGIIRGNHFHTRKIERFSVISGKAKIQIREILSDKIIEFILSGNSPSYVDMPIWFTHNIKNIGDEDLVTIFWINEHYDDNDSDTFIEKV